MNSPKRQSTRTSNVACPPSKGRSSNSPARHGHVRRQRNAGAIAATWLIAGITVPILSFLITLYTPTILHRLEPSVHHAATIVAEANIPLVSQPALLSDSDLLKRMPVGSICMDNPNLPLDVQEFRENDVPLTVVIGGTLGTRRSPVREGVSDFVKQTGATAGLNGTFFANASLSGTDNLLIGPSICSGENHLLISPFDTKPQLMGRPMVLMSATKTALVPYRQGVTDDEASLRGFMPNLTDAFLGGVWLVHNGIAADQDAIDSYNMKDAMDPRRRAFFAIMPDGRPVLGATTYVATSRQLASALEKVGVQEAVLLDSGFSTSLVFQDKVLVTGHTAPGIPSRPVPHALVLFGQPTAQTAKSMMAAPQVERIRRRVRHRALA